MADIFTLKTISYGLPHGGTQFQPCSHFQHRNNPEATEKEERTLNGFAETSVYRTVHFLTQRVCNRSENVYTP